MKEHCWREISKLVIEQVADVKITFFNNSGMKRAQGESEKILSLLVQQGLPIKVCQQTLVGGGRGLFLDSPRAKNVAIGPIVPLASVPKSAKPHTWKRNIKQHRGKFKRVSPCAVEGCKLCLSEQRRSDCKVCRNLSAEDAATERALQMLLQAHESVEARSMSKSNFTRIAERILFRVLLEAKLELENTKFLVTYLVSPSIGTEIIEKEWDPLWRDSFSRILQTASTAGVDLVSEKDLLGERELFFKVLGGIHLNSVEGSEASCLYPALSFVNHSCNPSCGVLFSGAAAYLVPNRDLSEEEELTIHYAESHNMSHAQLNRFLSHNYGFECPPSCNCKDQNSTPA